MTHLKPTSLAARILAVATIEPQTRAELIAKIRATGYRFHTDSLSSALSLLTKQGYLICDHRVECEHCGAKAHKFRLREG